MDIVQTHWTNRLAMDAALLLEQSGETLDEVLERHSLTAEQFVSYSKDPVFLRKVQDLREDISDNGVTFRLKARAQAEELLTTSWELIHSPSVSASVKADLIKATVKWGGLEPKTTTDAGSIVGGVSIHINLNNKEPVVAQMKTIEHDDPG